MLPSAVGGDSGRAELCSHFTDGKMEVWESMTDRANSRDPES